MKEEKIRAIASDEAFIKELLNKETPEEAQAMLAEREIDLCLEDIVKMRAIIEKKMEQAQAGEEITDDDLEDVAGGCVDPFSVILLVGMVGAIVVGFTPLLINNTVEGGFRQGCRW